MYLRDNLYSQEIRIRLCGFIKCDGKVGAVIYQLSLARITVLLHGDAQQEQQQKTNKASESLLSDLSLEL